MYVITCTWFNTFDNPAFLHVPYIVTNVGYMWFRIEWCYYIAQSGIRGIPFWYEAIYSKKCYTLCEEDTNWNRK